MKFTFSLALAAGLFLFVSIAPAQVTAATAQRLCLKLKFNQVKCFSEARGQFKTNAVAVEFLKDYLPNQSLQVFTELQKIMPAIEEALQMKPEECAIVSVIIDSSTNAVAEQYRVRRVRLEGIGDTAIQSLATNVVARTFGSGREDSADGFNFDPNLSHILCFGVDKGEIKASAVFLPMVRITLVSAIHDLQKAEGASQRPTAPGNLRIQSAP